jgi:hypothetical protein
LWLYGRRAPCRPCRNRVTIGARPIVHRDIEREGQVKVIQTVHAGRNAIARACVDWRKCSG